MLRARRFLRRIFALLALVGYLANGAATHLQTASGEVVPVLICGDGTNRVAQLVLGEDAPAEPTRNTCCGDCVVGHALAPAGPAGVITPERRSIAQRGTSQIPPPIRVVLWPGAPPRGPPVRA